MNLHTRIERIFGTKAFDDALSAQGLDLIDFQLEWPGREFEDLSKKAQTVISSTEDTLFSEEFSSKAETYSVPTDTLKY